MKKTFQVKLGGAGKYGDVAFVEMPFDIREVWGKARVPVKGTINGYPFRTTVATMKGMQCFCVNADMRKGAKAGVGDTVTVEIEPDMEKRTVEIPEELRKALGAKVSGLLEKMAFTHQKEYVRWYTDARKEETRERRVAKMKEMIAEGKPFS